MHRLLDLTVGLAMFALMGALVLAYHQHGGFEITADPAILAAASLVSILLGLRRLVFRPNKPGLLNGRIRPALTREERTRLASANVAADLAAKEYVSDRDHPQSLVAIEITRLVADWVQDRKSNRLSDDELRSIFQLNMYADPNNALTDEERATYLADVAEASRFTDLRNRIETYWRVREERAQDEDAWRAHIGDTAMNDLLKEGWVEFLVRQADFDPAFWHSIATGFDELDEGDRLEAAFWILQQADCDRATASDFIRGFAAYGYLEFYAEARDWPVLDRYRILIDRYNAGFYRWHGLRADVAGIRPVGVPVKGVFDTKALVALFEEIEEDSGIPALPRPKSLLDFDLAPGRAKPNTYASPYEVREGEGLHLRYPGPGWRMAS